MPSSIRTTSDRLTIFRDSRGTAGTASSHVATLAKAVTRDKKILNDERMVLEVIQLRYSDREAASCRTALIEAAMKLEVEFQLLVLIGGLDVLGRRPKVFGKQNPVARLRSLIEESLLVDGASKETFYAE